MRPLPRYVLGVMAAFIAFELWVPVLAIVLRALLGSTVPTAVQLLASLLGFGVPTVVALALSDYLADRRGLVRPYQPTPQAGDELERGPDDRDEDEGDQEDQEDQVDQAGEAADEHQGEAARRSQDGAGAGEGLDGQPREDRSQEDRGPRDRGGADRGRRSDPG